MATGEASARPARSTRRWPYVLAAAISALLMLISFAAYRILPHGAERDLIGAWERTYEYKVEYTSGRYDP